MLSLVELERVAIALTLRWVGGRVERWVEPAPGRICVSLYRRDENEQRKSVLDLDARPDVAHLGELVRMPGAPESLPAFSAYLRAHLSRARLESASLRGGDRQLALRFSAEEGAFDLVLSIFGRKSNLYLLDAEGRLLQSLRPLRDTRNELELGQPYRDPASGPPRVGEDRFSDVPEAELLLRIAERYSGERAEQSADDVRRRLLSILKKERKVAERRIERIEEELREADEINALEHYGELLKANLARVVPGAASVTVADFTTSDPVEIPLDPKLSARQNLEALFKRYQKLIRRLAKAGGQIDTAREALSALVALETEIERAEAGSEALAEILARENVARLLARGGELQGASDRGRRGSFGAAGGASGERGEGVARAANEKPAVPAAYRDKPRRLHPRRYKTAVGLEIWVGRSDEANDFLTTRLARGKDLFFHLAGAPGSHVILRTEGRDDPPSEAVLDACELAVHFSKQKNAGSAEVHVVPIKNVRKPKGAKPGLVYVTGGRALHLRREPARLERVLAARIDD
jgi:predicted ribosome quality control (RQC) complex YloA/Tae2 family protein